MILICDNCGMKFERHRANVFPDRHTFCNIDCRREFQSRTLNYDDVLDFLVKYILEHGGVAPTYREITNNCEVSSTSHVKYVLERLAETGLVVLLGDGKARGIQVVGMQLAHTDPRGRGEMEESMPRLNLTNDQVEKFIAELNLTDDQVEKPITEYWRNHYVNKGHCSLCGNSGIIDTTGVRTAAGVIAGRKNYCICPNGQSIRKQEAV